MKSNQLIFALSFALQHGSAYGYGSWRIRSTQNPTSSPTSTPTSAPTSSPTSPPTSAPTPTPEAPAQNYTTARVELDPEPSSIVRNCTYNFTEKLNSMVSTWFVDAVASRTGSYPPVSNPDNLFSVGYSRGQKWGKNRGLNEEVVNDQKAFPKVEHPHGTMHENGDTRQGTRRLGCQMTGCGNCCTGASACSTFCSVTGSCRGCPTSRNLRREEDRMLARRWYWGGEDMLDDVADSIQFAAKRWLHQNDPTRCMGNPWRLTVYVNYF